MSFEALTSAFAEAASGSPAEVAEQQISLCGFSSRWQVCGSRLADRTLRPMRHLRREPSAGERAPELTVDIWDQATTGVELPIPLPPPGQSYSDGDRVAVHATERAVTMFDRATGRVVGWRADELAGTEEAWRPLGWVLPLWCVDQRISVIHGALVAVGDRGVLIVGNGGAGKSTTALACAAAGLGFLGDDFVAIEWGAPDVGYSLSAAARVTAETLERYPDLRLVAEPIEANGKSLQYLDACATVLGSVPIQRVLIPRATGGGGAASAGQALLAFGPGSLMNFPGGGSWGMTQIAAMLRRLPIDWLDIGAGPQSAAAAISEIGGRD